VPDDIDLGFAAGLPPREAIAFLKAKGYAASWNWWEVWESAHARAFTVAKAMQSDVLVSIREALDVALSKGTTRREFARELEPTLRKLGWWGRQVIVSPDGGAERVQLGSPHRLRTIFDSNMRSTFGAARQGQQEVNAESRPFWMYDSRNDSRVRPSHAAMDGQVFRHDDPIWQSHYPPNGWNCRCRVRALTAAQVRSRGLRVRDSAGALTSAPQKVGVDKRTGEVIERPGTAYRFRGVDGEMHTMLPDAGWGSAPASRGLAPPPVAPAALPLPDSGPAARDAIREAAAGARRRLVEQQERLNRANAVINDPDRPTPPGAFAERAAIRGAMDDSVREMVARARGVFLRRRAAAFRGGTEPRLAADAPEAVADGVEQWRRMVAPDLVGRVRAPRIDMIDSRAINGDAAYWNGHVRIARSPGGKSHQRVLAHELSHLLEVDEMTFRSAVGFLSRRTAGERAVLVSDYRALRDEWIDFDNINDYRGRWRGGPGGSRPARDSYPGRIYPTEGENVADWGWGAHEGVLRTADGDVAVWATEVLSRGVEWMWTNPLAFAEADPDYFDFIWRVVVLGR